MQDRSTTDLTGFYGVVSSGAMLVGMWPESLPSDDRETLQHIIQAYGYLLSSSAANMQPVKHSFAQFAQAIEAVYDTSTGRNQQIVQYLKNMDSMLLHFGKHQPPARHLH